MPNLAISAGRGLIGLAGCGNLPARAAVESILAKTGDCLHHARDIVQRAFRRWADTSPWTVSPQGSDGGRADISRSPARQQSRTIDQLFRILSHSACAGARVFVRDVDRR